MHDFFVRLARGAAGIVAHPIAFVLGALSVAVWAALGPVFDYSEAWQLVINTGTTILTFLMVFLLQNTQNRDSRAMQIKLDELLRAVKGARTELVDLENVTEAELARYCDEFKVLTCVTPRCWRNGGARSTSRPTARNWRRMWRRRKSRAGLKVRGWLLVFSQEVAEEAELGMTCGWEGLYAPTFDA